MNQQGTPPPPQPPPPSSTTENPIVAVGRKVKSEVKSALSSSQRPSVRIQRGYSSTGEFQRAPIAEATPAIPERHSLQTGPGQRPAAAVDTPGTLPKEDASSSHIASIRNRAGSAWRSLFGHDNQKEDVADDGNFGQEYDSEMVDLLDVVDPEVSTLSTLTNVQNSLFIPSMGKFLNRRPTYRIPERPREILRIDKIKASLKHIKSKMDDGDEKEADRDAEEPEELLPSRSPETVTSTLESAQYAILPTGKVLVGWTKEDQEELDDMVRHELHSRRARTRRALKGFLQYVRRPLGLFVTVYATLVTLFGLAWVLFLIGWISLGSRQSYIINIVDNVLVALFAVIGDGLAPFRAVDTYHMIYIAHYHRKTWKRRETLGLPELANHNDLPDQRKEEIEPTDVDIESMVARRVPRGIARRIAKRIPKQVAWRIFTRNGGSNVPYEYSVLTKEEQVKLEFHERKFSKSHTFYKPHETETHFAFPLKLLVAVVLLLDCHSLLQISLGACTWGINYKKRPFALTTVILCCSITCNILGGVLISIGDKRTRKHDVIERMMRQELTSEAMEQMEIRRMKEAEERGELDKSERKKFEKEKDEAENEEIKQSWKHVPMLPKTLLGKGVDNRQPSLPQKARRSSSSVDTESSSTPTSKKLKTRSGQALPSVQEDLTQISPPGPMSGSGHEPPKEGTGHKIMRMVRRADLDRT